MKVFLPFRLDVVLGHQGSSGLFAPMRVGSNRSLPPFGTGRHPRESGDPCLEVTGFPPSRE